jgi:hypothetical protein
MTESSNAFWLRRVWVQQEGKRENGKNGGEEVRRRQSAGADRKAVAHVGLTVPYRFHRPSNIPHHFGLGSHTFPNG